jgi:ribosomal protein S20
MGDAKLNNSRILAKYKRIKNLEKQVQSANVTQIIVIFSIVIVVLSTMLIYNIIRKNEAEKIIRSFDLQNPLATDFSEIEGMNPPTQS